MLSRKRQEPPPPRPGRGELASPTGARGEIYREVTRVHERGFAMSPLLIYGMVFLAVSAIIGVLFFIFGEGQAKTAERLDMLTGRRKKEDETTTILKKTAVDRDKRSLLEALTPNVPSLQKLIMQADANITPS